MAEIVGHASSGSHPAQQYGVNALAWRSRIGTANWNQILTKNGAVATTFSDAVGYKTEAENGHKTVKIFGTKSTPDSGAVDMTLIDVGELNKGIPSLISGDTQDPTSGTRGLHKGAPRKKSIGRVLSIVRS